MNDCDDHCKSTFQLFQTHNEVGWASKNKFIAAVYEKNGVKVSAEIGVAHGTLSHDLLTMLPTIEHHGIDPFIGGYRQGVRLSTDMSAVLKQHGSEVWARAILYKMKDFGCRFQLHHNFSSFAINDFEPSSLDAIFIDGLHSLKGVSTDIALYASRVRKGGVIGFDDYEITFRGIMKAVDMFASANQLTLKRFNPDDSKVVYVLKTAENLNVSMLADLVHRN